MISKRKINFLWFLTLSVSSLTSHAETFQVNLQIKPPPVTLEEQTGAALDTLLPGLTALPTRTVDQQQLVDIATVITNADPNLTGGALKALSARASSTETSMVTKASVFGRSSYGKIFSSLRRGTARSSWAGSYSLSDAMNAAFKDKLSTWAGGDFAQPEQIESANEAGFTGASQRFNLGADYRLSSQIYSGLAASVYHAKMDITENGGSLEASNYGINWYGGYYFNEYVSFDASVFTEYRKFELARTIQFSVLNSTVSQVASSQPAGSHLGAQANATVEYPLPYGIRTAMTGGLTTAHSSVDAFDETGAGGLNLHVGKQVISTLTALASAHISKALSFRRTVLVPQATLSWMHEFDTNAEVIRSHFSVDPGQNPFEFSTPKRDPNYLTYALGVSAIFPGGLTAYANYEGVAYLRDFSQSLFALGARWEY